MWKKTARKTELNLFWIPWVHCAFLCVKDDWKGQFLALRYFLSKLTFYSVFPSGMTSHSKIAQFNWQCIAPLRIQRVFALVWNLTLCAEGLEERTISVFRTVVVYSSETSATPLTILTFFIVNISFACCNTAVNKWYLLSQVLLRRFSLVLAVLAYV